MSAPAQTPSRITPLTVPATGSAAPTKAVASTPIVCPPGQIKDSTGNCVVPSDLIKSLSNAQAPKTPPVLASAPAPTVATAPPSSPRAPLKQPRFNTHVQQTAQGGANPPTIQGLPGAPGVPGAPGLPGAAGTSGPPPSTPTIPPAVIPPPTPQPPKPLPPTAVPPRQTPIIPPIQHPPEPRPIPENQRPPGEFQRRFPVCTFQRFPDKFHDFDHRFDDDRRRHNCLDFREEFDDDDDRRFRPFIDTFRGRLNVTLVEHILGLIYDPGSAAQGRDVPTGGGIWVLGVDGQWYRVNQADLDLINQIESTRMIDRHNPIIIGGGSIIGLHAGNDPPFNILGNPTMALIVGAAAIGAAWMLMGKKKI